MAVESFYFSHDYNARSDGKMIALQMSMGMEGVGLYWCVVEMLYEEGGFLKFECERIAFALRADKDRIEMLIKNFDLFIFDSEKFWSESVLRRIEIRDNKSNKARESALKRWNDRNNANVMRTHSDGNAIKERKVKEIKEKKVKEIVAVDTANKETRELDFMNSLKPYIGQYEKPMLREFYNYWIEPMKSGKMRFEAEKFWSLGRRLSTWSNNIKTNKYAKQPIGTPEDQRERIAAFLAAKESRGGGING